MMKKSLIALAIAAAAPAAFAATSNVDVYGQVRLSMDKTDAAGAAWTMADRVSRIGFKGSEDLGGGMSAIWGLEWDLTFVDGATSTGTGNVGGITSTTADTFGQRNQFIGLKGAFGTVLAGVHDTPYKLAGSADVFADTAADAQGAAAIIGRAGTASFDMRAQNAIAYISPDYNGFHAAVAVIPGETTTTANDLSNAQSLALVYVNGPLKVTYGYEDHADLANESAQKVNVGYKMGDLAVGATYETQDIAGDTRKAHLVSAAYGMGPITLLAQYGKADRGAATADLKRTVVGAGYALSKRTNAYLGYQISDDAGTETKTTTLGLNHSF